MSWQLCVAPCQRWRYAGVTDAALAVLVVVPTDKIAHPAARRVQIGKAIRLELRFHHSVVQQFTLGSQNVHTGGTIGGHTYADLVPHLDGLWRYGCEAFRLLDRPGMYNPFWTLISQDVRVSVPCVSLVDHTTHKRHYKAANGFSGKNVDLFIGNMVSLLARKRVGAKKAMASLKELDCWPVIRDHYAAKGKTEHGIYLHIKELLQERTVRWGRAI